MYYKKVIWDFSKNSYYFNTDAYFLKLSQLESHIMNIRYKCRCYTFWYIFNIKHKFK